MKGNGNFGPDFKPGSKPKTIKEIYRDDRTPQAGADVPVTTSLKLRGSTKDRLKTYAAMNHTTMGEVLEQAINQWIDDRQ